MSPGNAEKIQDQLRKHALTLAEEQAGSTEEREVYAFGSFLVPLTQKPV